MSMKRNIAKAKETRHLADRGSLIEVVYDTEIYNLDKNFSGIYDAGFTISDIADNEIGTPVHYLRQPKDSIHSLVSNLITRTFPEDHAEAVDFKTFVGKINETLDRPYRYIWERYRDEQEVTIVNKGHQKRNEETVRLFPIENDDGEIEHIRLHDGGAKVSYQVPEYSANWNYTDIAADGTKTHWRRVNSSAEMIGYANSSADDPWIWSTLYMGLSPQIYKTHTKAENKYRTDYLKVTIARTLWGDKGENGVKPGRRHHPVRGHDVVSYKQSDLLPANTRNEGPFHERGMFLDDGSDYDPDQAHGTLTDTKGTKANVSHAKRVDLPIKIHFDKMADPHYAKEFLMGRTPDEPATFNDRPLRAFARYDLENEATSHLGMCVETDERYGNRNNAVMLKLDVNWDDLMYEGQRILDIKNKKKLKKAVKAVLFNKFGKYDSLVETTHVKKTPMVYGAREAMEAGAHTQEQYDLALRNRSKIRRNKNFMEAVMEVYEDSIPQIKAVMDNKNPLDEELKDNFTGNPFYFETPTRSGKVNKIGEPTERGKDGEYRIRDARDEVYGHAFHEWDTGLKRDKLLQDLLRPHSIEWCDPAHEETELKEFNTILKNVRTKINAYNKRENTGHLDRPSIIIPDMQKPASDEERTGLKAQYFSASEDTLTGSAPSTQDEAKRYLTQLRFQALWSDYNDDPSFRFNDYNWRVEVVDTDGHTVPWEAYDDMSEAERREKWDNGELDVRLQSLEGHTIRRLGRLMYESGELDELIQNFATIAKNTADAEEKDSCIEKIRCLKHHKDLYEARAAFMLHGYRNMNPEKQPYLTIAKARIQATEILQNVKMGALHKTGIDDVGALEFMADHKDEAERICVKYLEYLDRKEKEIPPPTNEQFLLLGIDPESGEPLPYIRHKISPDNTIEVTCPDSMCQSPLSNSDIGSTFIIIELPEGLDFQGLQDQLDKNDAQIVTVGSQSGERRLAAKAKVVPLWSSEDDDYYDNEIKAFRNSYTNVNQNAPTDRDRLAIVKVEELPLIAGLRGDGKFVNPSLQTLNVPYSSSHKRFEGMVSKELGNTETPVSGLVMLPDDIKQDISKGPIRIREMYEDEETGREIEHTVTKVSTLNVKKFMSAFELLSDDPKAANDITPELAKENGFDSKEELTKYVSALRNHDRYGYATMLDMHDSALGMFTKNRNKVTVNPEKYSITLIDLKKERDLSKLRDTMAYFHLTKRPRATLEHHNNTLGAAKIDNTMLYTGAYVGHSPTPED